MTRTAKQVQKLIDPWQFVTAKQRGNCVMLVRRDGTVATVLTPSSLEAGDETFKTRLYHCLAFMKRQDEEAGGPAAPRA